MDGPEPMPRGAISVGPWLPDEGPPVPHAPDGPLAGRSFGVKDIIDVAGRRTGCGNPDRLADAAPAPRHAPVVAALLAAGARYAGKTRTVELAFSLDGRNEHEGTPVNGAAPGRIPGGSSSGSASAVSLGDCDLALGSDTGGSIRGPAALCGLVGLRSTHGRLGLEGVMPLAPSLDTLGWLTRDPALDELVAAVLLGDDRPGPPLSRAIVATDALAWIDEPAVAEAVADALPRVLAHLGASAAGTLAPEGLAARYEVLRTIQAREAWLAHGPWIEARRPRLGDAIRARFDAAAAITDAQHDAAVAARAVVRERMAALVRDDTVVVLPTLPRVAPPVDASAAALEAFRMRGLPLLCSAGLAGLPQVSLPMTRADGLPVGISLIGPAGRDRALLALGRVILEG